MPRRESKKVTTKEILPAGAGGKPLGTARHPEDESKSTAKIRKIVVAVFLDFDGCMDEHVLEFRRTGNVNTKFMQLIKNMLQKKYKELRAQGYTEIVFKFFNGSTRQNQANDLLNFFGHMESKYAGVTVSDTGSIFEEMPLFFERLNVQLVKEMPFIKVLFDRFTISDCYLNCYTANKEFASGNFWQGVVANNLIPRIRKYICSGTAGSWKRAREIKKLNHKYLATAEESCDDESKFVSIFLLSHYLVACDPDGDVLIMPVDDKGLDDITGDPRHRGIYGPLVTVLQCNPAVLPKQVQLAVWHYQHNYEGYGLSEPFLEQITALTGFTGSPFKSFDQAMKFMREAAPAGLRFNAIQPSRVSSFMINRLRSIGVVEVPAKSSPVGIVVAEAIWATYGKFLGLAKTAKYTIAKAMPRAKVIPESVAMRGAGAGVMDDSTTTILTEINATTDDATVRLLRPKPQPMIPGVRLPKETDVDRAEAGRCKQVAEEVQPDRHGVIPS